MLRGWACRAACSAAPTMLAVTWLRYDVIALLPIQCAMGWLARQRWGSWARVAAGRLGAVAGVVASSFTGVSTLLRYNVLQS